MFLFLFPLPQVKYKQKYEETKGHYKAVLDTPQILHAKSVATLVSEVGIYPSILFIHNLFIHSLIQNHNSLDMTGVSY